jgi:hypothetical protein
MIVGCGSQYTRDPAARVVVTSRYENEPEKIVSTSDPKPLVDCTNLSKGECAIALYNDSERFIAQGEEYVDKGLYVSATLEYMQALCRLEASKISLNEAKLNTFQDYQIVMQFQLEEKVEEKIRFCERRIRSVQWR